MKSKIIRQAFLVLVLATSLLADEVLEDLGIESITGTREPEDVTATPETVSAVATTMRSFRESRWYRRGSLARGDDHDDHDMHDDMHDDMKDDMPDDPEMKGMAEAKGDYLGGYYDFLINEGSYKFWAVFQLGTAALLIYSGFAALYYAKVNPPTDDDYGDYFLRRRRSVDRPPQERTFLGLSPETFQRIVDAIAREFH